MIVLQQTPGGGNFNVRHKYPPLLSLTLVTSHTPEKIRFEHYGAARCGQFLGSYPNTQDRVRL